MRLTDFLAAIADIGIVAIIIYLIFLHRKVLILVSKNGGTMSTPESDAIDWTRRQGRFFQCDDDTLERPQVMPGPLIPTSDQTHTRTAGGEYRDGIA